MVGEATPPLNTAQKAWALAAAVLFLIAVTFAGFAISTQVLVVFAVGWVALQVFGYVGALKFAHGDFAHPLFRSQVMLNVVALGLLIATIARAT